WTTRYNRHESHHALDGSALIERGATMATGGGARRRGRFLALSRAQPHAVSPVFRGSSPRACPEPSLGCVQRPRYASTSGYKRSPAFSANRYQGLLASVLPPSGSRLAGRIGTSVPFGSGGHQNFCDVFVARSMRTTYAARGLSAIWTWRWTVT